MFDHTYTITFRLIGCYNSVSETLLNELLSHNSINIGSAYTLTRYFNTACCSANQPVIQLISGYQSDNHSLN
jgi:hypothetical protein